MSGDLNGTQKKVRDVYQSAIFVHCHAHVLKLVVICHI